MLRVAARQLFVKNWSYRFLTSGSRLYSYQPVAESVIQNNDQYLAVQWNNGKVDEFPHFYLRENCSCSQCFQTTKKSRNMFAPTELDLHVSAESAKIDSNKLNVTWTDGHSSIYSSENLESLRYHPVGEGSSPGVLTEKMQLWGEEASFENGTLPVFDFSELLKDDKVLYKWLVALACETGVAKLENIPSERQQLSRLGNRVGYLLSTNYGICYDIKAYSEDVAGEIGYTSSTLPLHSDYVFTNSPPAIAMFHCLVQTKAKGGENQWIDGFHAAHRLYQEDPESFNILTTTPINYRNITRTGIGAFHTTSSHRLISLNRAGKLSQVGYSDEFRDRHMPLEPKQMKAFYKAYIRFTELLLDSKSSFWFKMKDGDGITANNHRCLHARNGYEDAPDNSRLFQLAYLDWDCVHSKIRIISEQMGVPCPLE